MINQKQLTLLFIGNHTPSLRKIQRWVQQGVLSLAGIWDCHLSDSDHLFLESYVGQLLPNDPESLFQFIREQQVDIIFNGDKQPEIISTALQLKPESTLLIDPGTFWILERLIDQSAQLRELKVSQQEMHTILNYSHEGVQFVDAQGVIRYVNPAFTKITGIAAEHRIGRDIFEVSPEGALAKTLLTQRPVLQWRNSVKETTVEVISNAAPIYVDGHLSGAVTTFQNVTEMLQLSQRLRERDSEIKQLQAQLKEVHTTQYSFTDIIGESQPIQEAIALAKKVAHTSSTILITGESGTGKELFAHAIHQASSSEKPFIVVNCAAIPEALLESELFGHEKGAFTNAFHKKLGKVEIAHGGTLFLDEIGDMSPPLQAKLLRFLQSKQFERIGGLKPIEVHVRIIAATNRHLEQMVQENKFREDLYYRLNVVRIEIPPLRQRLQDLPFLSEYLIKKIGSRLLLSPKNISNKALAMLADYHWPGNVRELENFFERLMNESNDETIADSLVFRHVQRLAPHTQAIPREDDSSANNIQVASLRSLEQHAIKKAIDLYGSSVEGKKRAASSLGISLATLYNKLKDYPFAEEGK